MYCITNKADAAEDLAQNIMLEAWRNIAKLRDKEKISQWLSFITCNKCIDWISNQKRQKYLLEKLQLDKEILSDDLTLFGYDIEAGIEHNELVRLLDQALAMLSPITWAVLILRYIEESSLHEIAEKLDLQISAVAMRLQRGKSTVRHVLSNELKMEIQSYGLQRRNAWEQMSAWCTLCGRQHLVGQFQPAESTLFLTCPECGDYSHTNLIQTSEAQLFYGIKRVKPALSRLRNWIHRYYYSSLDSLIGSCIRCGQMQPLQIVSSFQKVDAKPFSGKKQNARGIYQVCNNCQLYNWISLEELILSLPEGQQFLKEYPQIRTLPERQVEKDNQKAFVTRFESVTDQILLEVVSTSDTYQTICINQGHS